MSDRSSQTYFHGTCLKVAVDSLLEGECLEPLRPLGASSFPRSRNDLVYLTPSFNQAAEYAFMRSRSDWPSSEQSWFSATSHIFEFHMENVEVSPEEDELGFAVKAALCRNLGRRHEWNMNSEFADQLVNSMDVMRSLCEVADHHMTSNKMRQRLEHPETWKGTDKTAVGRHLLKTLNPNLSQRLVDLGISVVTQAKIKPTAAFALPMRVMRPEDANELWRIPTPDRDGSPATSCFM